MPSYITRLIYLGFTLLTTQASLLGELHFAFPTANHALIKEGGEEAFFVGTPGKPWQSGSFGCVRSSGYQFHEGADIRAVQRDKRNEPTDPVLSTADGWVVHTSRKSGLSNYGKYVVIGHKIEGLEVYSLYAHLSSILPQWTPGKWIRSGEQIGVMGRTSNTRQRISKERAHLHFELALLINEHYPAYFKKRYPKGRNDHGIWNGQNLLGMDPAEIFRQQHADPDSFSLRSFLREKEAMFSVQVSQLDFPWIRRYVPLILKSTDFSPQQTNAYEISFDFSGLPFQLKPLALETPPDGKNWKPLQVNEEIRKANPCRKLIVKTGAKWRLTAKGRQLIEALLFETP